MHVWTTEGIYYVVTQKASKIRFESQQELWFAEIGECSIQGLKNPLLQQE